MFTSAKRMLDNSLAQKNRGGKVQQNTLPIRHNANKNLVPVSESKHPPEAESQPPSNLRRLNAKKVIQMVSVSTQTCQQHQPDYGMSELPTNIMQTLTKSSQKSSMELLVSKMKSVTFREKVYCLLHWCGSVFEAL